MTKLSFLPIAAVLALLATADAAGAMTAASASGAKAGAAAAAVQPSQQFRQRAEEVIAVYNGKGDMRKLLSPSAAAQVKTTTDEVGGRVNQMFARIRSKAGPAHGISRIEAKTPYRGDVYVTLDKMEVLMTLSIEAEAPHLIRYFNISNTAAKAGPRRR